MWSFQSFPSFPRPDFISSAPVHPLPPSAPGAGHNRAAHCLMRLWGTSVQAAPQPHGQPSTSEGLPRLAPFSPFSRGELGCAVGPWSWSAVLRSSASLCKHLLSQEQGLTCRRSHTWPLGTGVQGVWRSRGGTRDLQHKRWSGSSWESSEEDRWVPAPGSVIWRQPAPGRQGREVRTGCTRPGDPPRLEEGSIPAEGHPVRDLGLEDTGEGPGAGMEVLRAVGTGRGELCGGFGVCF